MANEGTGVTQGFSPIYPYGLRDFRSWTDLNGDGTALNPDGTPQVAEVGPSNNPNYGLDVITTTYDTNMRRGTNWEYSGGVERQLAPGWAVSAMWHRRSYDNFRWTDNLNNSVDDYVFAGTWTGPTDLPPSARGVQVPDLQLAAGRPNRKREGLPDERSARLADVERFRGHPRRRTPPQRLHDRELYDGQERGPPLHAGRIRGPQRAPGLRNEIALPTHGQAVGGAAACRSRR